MSELETIDLATNNDVISTSSLITRRQQKQVDYLKRTMTMFKNKTYIV